MATNEATPVPWWLMGAVDKPGVLSVYVALDKINRTTGWASTAAISDECHMSGVTVVRAVRELERVGAVRSQERFAEGGGRMPNTYVLATAEPFVAVA